MAEQILENRQADIIGMTRANICDPDLPNKAREGRLDEIRHCIACNEGCWGHIERSQPITCAINPAIGREQVWGEFNPTSSPKTVAIIGGGPAGCEAARVAAAVGHRVTLFEQTDALGGQTNIAAKGPGRTDMAEVGRYFSVELKRLGVDVRLSTRATAADVLALSPDQVFVATGGTPRVPDHIVGIERSNVVQSWDVLNGVVTTGQRVLVLDDENHVQGMNVAEKLAAEGKEVQVLTREFECGKHMEPNTRMTTLRRVHALNIKLSPTTWAKEVGPDYAVIYNFYSNQEERIPVDTVVLACSIDPETALAAELSRRHPSVRTIGDCNGPRRLELSTFEGHLAARALDDNANLGALMGMRRAG